MEWLLALLLLGTMSWSAVAQSQTAEEEAGSEDSRLEDLKARQRAGVEQMRQNDPDVRARWDRNTGLLTRLQGRLSESLPGTAQQIALRYFDASRSMLNMNDAYTELSVIDVETDQRGWEHVKLQQVYKTLPVEGRQLVVSISDQRQVRMVNCRHFVSEIAVDTAAVVQRAAAIDLARAHLAAQREGQQSPTALKIVYPYAGQAYLAWKVRLQTEEPLGDFIYFINARTGAVINHYHDLKFALDRLTYDGLTLSALPGTLIRNEVSVDTGDQPLDDAHNFAGDVYAYYAGFGRDSYDDAGATITSTVHHQVGFNNAFWNGQQMVYGDGDGVLFDPLSQSLDVVAHEITHAVTTNESNLIYQNESGALNESLSDIFGALIDATNWQIGEDIYTPLVGGDALRYLDTPAIAGQQPDHWDDFATPNASGSALDQACNSAQNQDNGCVHINSGIPNKAAYLMAVGGTHGGVTVNALGGGRADMGAIFMRRKRPI